MNRRLLIILAILVSNIPGFSQVSLNYSFSQYNEPYARITGGTVLGTATSSTVAGAPSLDNVIYNLPAGTIPFTFNFDNINYTGIYVSCNGFLTFGSTPPAGSGSTTGDVPLSGITAYSGAASAMGRNLNAYFFAGDPNRTGEIRYETVGSAPNRKFVVQYRNFRPFATGATFGQVFNFQIRLVETSNAVEFAYDTVVVTTTNATTQIGLRGPNNVFPTNINNRLVTNGTHTWATSVPGIANNSGVAYAPTLVPAIGLVYRFAPPSCKTPQFLSATNITQTTAKLTWRVTGGTFNTFNVEYGPSGFSLGTGTKITGITDTTLNISGLTITTPYQYYVRHICSGTDSSTLTGPYTFTTGNIGEDCLSAPVISVANDSASAPLIGFASGVSANGPNSQCSDITGFYPNDDVWAKFVAPSTSNKLVLKGIAGTGFGGDDWVMEVWRGCPESGGTKIGCIDDVSPTAKMPYLEFCQNQYVAGETLYVRLWTYSQTAVATMSLQIYKATECAIPPTNDECSLAISVPVGIPFSCPAGAVVHSTKYATPSGDAATCQSATKHDVWFKFNTGNFGDIRVTMSQVTSTSLKAQILFACGDFEVDCWNPASGSHVLTGLNPVADYILRVWSDSGAWGNFNICIEDICSDPTASMGGVQSICNGDSIYTPIDFTGTPPWTFVYTDGVTNYNVVTSADPYFLALAPAVNTLFSPVSIADISCSGLVSGQTQINVVQKPEFYSFSPTSGPVGTVVTIYGKYLSTVVSVGFNNVATSGFTIVNDSTITVTVPAGTTTGVCSIANFRCTVNGPGIFTVTGVPSVVQLTIKAFIEGFYITGGTMTPVPDPVNQTNLCDTVLVSLASATPPYSILNTRKGPININGQGTFPFPYSTFNGGSYYIVFKHRNSVEVWSKNPVTISQATFYDFTIPTGLRIGNPNQKNLKTKRK